MIAELAGAAALATWLYLLAGRGGFWLVREEPAPATPASQRSVAVVIPARNEASSIGQAIASLAAQDYAGPLDIFVVDDQSTDGTAGIARAAGDVTVIPGEPLPPGWTGKLWAVSQGLRAASARQPGYYLLTDADIVHAPGNLRELVARAEANQLDLVSVMVKLRCESLAERMLMPPFLFFFLKLYPPKWTAGAAGGCILIRPEALDRIGGIAAIRSELIDDCALAREVRRGGPIWMGVTTATLSIREYATFAEIGSMISRTAFTQLRYSAWMLAGTVIGLALTYLAPPMLAIFGPTPAAHGLGFGAWLLMSIAFVPTLRLYRRSLLWAPLLPLSATFYLGATLWSALSYWSGKGGLWKGRIQARA